MSYLYSQRYAWTCRSECKKKGFSGKQRLKPGYFRKSHKIVNYFYQFIQSHVVNSCSAWPWVTYFMNPSASPLMFWKSLPSPVVWSQSYLSNATRSWYPTIPIIIISMDLWDSSFCWEGSILAYWWLQELSKSIRIKQ